MHTNYVLEEGKKKLMFIPENPVFLYMKRGSTLNGLANVMVERLD